MNHHPLEKYQLLGICPSNPGFPPRFLIVFIKKALTIKKKALDDAIKDVIGIVINLLQK